MKRNNIIICLFSGITLLTACHDLDLNPLSYGSTENWYSNETEIEMAVNELYRDTFWPLDEEGNTDWSDDNIYRESLTPFQNATLNGQTDKVTDLWSKQYKVISRANGVILKHTVQLKLVLPKQKSTVLLPRLIFTGHVLMRNYLQSLVAYLW